jgi:hypothetical protein
MSRRTAASPLVLLLLAACADGGPDAKTAATGDSATTADSTTTTDSTTTVDSTTTADSATTGETTGAPQLPCNGHPALCDRPLDQLTIPATHNSFAALDDGFKPLAANHQTGVAAQLAAGIRGFMLDVTLDDGVPTLCHGPCWLGSIPHIDQVLEIADFLQNNPREVLFIIYQDDIDPAFIAADYEEAGLTDQLWAWDGGPMPTLGQLLEQNKRLILSAESAGPPPLWYHHAWDLYWDTPYSYTDPSEFTCELNRGAPGNPLFLINHWLSDDLGLPTQAGAAQVNTYDALYARATQCAREAGRPPTLLAIDFYEGSALIEVVNALNDL